MNDVQRYGMGSYNTKTLIFADTRKTISRQMGVCATCSVHYIIVGVTIDMPVAYNGMKCVVELQQNHTLKRMSLCHKGD